MARVEALFVYPVKGCRGVAVEEAELTPRGLRFDREWLVVHAGGKNDGKFITQRQKPKLALVEARVLGELLLVSSPGQPQLSLPLAIAGAPTRTVVIWEWTGPALDCGDAPAAWFSEYLGVPVRLVRFDPDATRPCDVAYAGEGHAATFSDGYPLLALSTSSLEALNAKLPAGEAKLNLNRFRPNLVLSGTPADDEDTWETVTVGGAALRAVKPCARCKVTTINQETIEEGMEPLETLGAVRTGSALSWAAADARENWGSSVFFGMNLVVDAVGCGRVKVGDALVVTKRKASWLLGPKPEAA